MSEALTAEGYEQTKQKLRDLETRLAEIEGVRLHPRLPPAVALSV